MKRASRPAQPHANGEELESELLHLFVGSVVNGSVLTLDAEGTVVGWTRAAEQAGGWARDAIVGRHFSALYAPGEVSARTPWQELERAEADGQSESEVWQVRQDGSRFRRSLITFGVRRSDGGLAGFVVLAQDLDDEVADDANPPIPLERRERIARLLRTGAIRTLFGVGLDLQALAAQAADARLRSRLETAIADLDRGIRELRAAVLRQ